MATGGTRAKNLSSAALDEEMADAAMSPAGWTVDQNPAIERQVARISECHVAVHTLPTRAPCLRARVKQAIEGPRTFAPHPSQTATGDRVRFTRPRSEAAQSREIRGCRRWPRALGTSAAALRAHGLMIPRLTSCERTRR